MNNNMFNSFKFYLKNNKLNTIYDEVNSFNDVEEFISYTIYHNKHLHFMYKDYSNNYTVKRKIYNLALEYYNICFKSLDKKDIENYKLVKKIFDDIKSLDYNNYEEYFNNLNSDNEALIKVLDIYNRKKDPIRNKSITSIPYSKTIIEDMNDYDPIEVKKRLGLLLEDRTESLEKEDKMVSPDDLTISVVLDNLVVKSMYNHDKLNELDILYLKEISIEMDSNPYLFLYLPLSRLDKETLYLYKEYIPLLENNIKKSKELYNEAKELNNLFNKGNISEEELDKLFKFLSYYMSNKDRINDEFNYDGLIKYLTNKKELTIYETSFMLKYLGYLKCYEKDMYDISIDFCDSDRGKNYRVFGLQRKGLVSVNKKYICGSSFKDNTLNDPITQRSNLKRFSYEATSLISVLYHELKHAFQFQEAYDGKSADGAYSYELCVMACTLVDGYYNRNYKFIPIETDADSYSYNELRKFALRYMPESIVADHAREFENYYSGKDKFNYNISRNRKKIITQKYEKEVIDYYFKLWPSELESKPLFKEFYNENGTSKKLVDVFSSINVSQNYQYKLITALLINGERITKNNFFVLPESKKKNAVNNIYRMLYKVNERLRYALDAYSNGQNYMADRHLLNLNIKVDIHVGKLFNELWNNILIYYPDIVDNNLKNRINNELRSFEEAKILLKDITRFNFEKEIKL